MSREIVKSEKFSRIKSLRCFRRIHDMLSFGYPSIVVAKFIQQQGESTDVKEDSLRQMLCRYRQDILPSDVLVNRQPHVLISARKKYTDRLEELRRLDDMFDALKFQFDVGHARYQMTGYLDKDFKDSTKALSDLIYKMHLIKMDLGISGKKELGTLTISAERVEEVGDKFGSEAAKAFDEPMSRAKVLACFKKIEDVVKLREKAEDGDVINVTPVKE